MACIDQQLKGSVTEVVETPIFGGWEFSLVMPWSSYKSKTKQQKKVITCW